MEAIAEDIRTDPRTRELRIYYPDSDRIVSMLVAPVDAGESMQGFICVECQTSRQWQEEECDFLARVAAAAVSWFAGCAVVARTGNRTITEEGGANIVADAVQRQQLLESIQDGIHVLDANGRVVFANPAGLAMLGWAEAELIGRSSHHAIHHHRPDGSEYPLEACPIYRSLEDGENRRIETEVFFRKDGTDLPVEYVCAPIRNERNQIIGAVVTFRDISRRVRTEREKQVLIGSLKERVKELGAMHRIGTILRQGRRDIRRLLPAVVQHLANAMQYPEAAAAQVEFDSSKIATSNFRITKWRIRKTFRLASGVSGSVCIAYLEEKPSSECGSFLQEEKELVNWA